MSLAEAADRARHDLGRYVALQVRWVGADGPADALREALDADLRHTRRSPGGDLGVAEVWAACREGLSGADPALLEPVDGLVARLGERASRLEALDEGALRETAGWALACAEQVRALARALAGPPE